MKLSDFDYILPPDRIAQTPATPRDSSRLFVYTRATGECQHTVFSNIGNFLNPGDLLVVNETRVLPARLYATKVETGGKVEVLLLKKRDNFTWEAMVGGKRVTVGKQLDLPEGVQAEVVEDLGGPRRLIRFSQPLESLLDQIGQMPLPPYIHERLEDPDRYQTVYADEAGSAAAPTAGLHFTPGLMDSLKKMGIEIAAVTLHVGLDTFAPVTEENVEDHPIHTEWCRLPVETANKIAEAKARGGRVVAVGTTSVRTLESAARAGGGVPKPFVGQTDLYIMPGYAYQAVDAIITNFHLPRSTLLMLVSAFTGRETILDLYQEAVAQNYRFYSFGDAMLIL
ncbi:MAG TPA: tRNA preQ1(34) S-adenosylmethionine ribosyltransferase-isomerase QueA [Anaerolineales bacterium]|nr:tRNA preQ1(34) S-adenosylmethionine ribosyltransferase-isomerase QueA [Anaerolineales bacterium]